jgi:hypothetical protein
VSRAAVRLCLCALLAACTDPRARPAPPTVQVLVSQTLHVTSPGTIIVEVYAYDPQGLDRLFVTVRSGYPTLQGDSTYFFTAPNEQTMRVLWAVPPGIPVGAQITFVAKANNVVGFTASDSTILPVQR